MKIFSIQPNAKSAGRRVSKIVFSRGSFFIVGILLLAFAVVVQGMDPKRVNADPLPVVHVSGTLTSDQTWTSGSVYMVDHTLTIPEGKTLTINAGTIVKLALDGGSNYGINTSEGGALNVDGDSGANIIFTSAQDDSVGGDSDGNGVSTGNVNNVHRAILNNGGTLSIAYADFRVGQDGALYVVCGSKNSTITNSIFKSGVIVNHCSASQLTLQQNQFNTSSDYQNYALFVNSSDASSITLSGTDKNNFTGSGKSLGLRLYNSSVGAGKTWTVDSSTNAVLSVYNQLKVDGILNIGSGMIVKSEASSNTWSMIQATTSGSVVNINGTSANPVVFTSYRDDSIGGDTNGDGNSGGGSADIFSTLGNTQGGTLNVTHADFHFGQSDAVTVECPQSTGSTIVTDSILRSGFSVSNCSQGTLILQRNVFELADVYANPAILSGGTNNWQGIVFSGPNKNTFVGTGRHVAVSLARYIDEDETTEISSEGGAIFLFDQLEIKGTLNIAAGTHIKVVSYRGSSWPPNNPGIKVDDGGMLNINGSSSSSVIVTSDEDDTVGGDMRNDGSTTGLSKDYYAAIQLQDGGTVLGQYFSIGYANQAILNNGGQLTISNATIHDSSVGLESTPIASGESLITDTTIRNGDVAIENWNGETVFRGVLDNDSMGVRACNWGVSSCVVDAAYTDWGNGIDPTATPAKICGSVWIYPWMGTPPASDSYLYVPNCDGSATPSAQMSTSANNLNNALADDYSNCSDVDNGTDPACNVIRITKTCMGSALNLAEQHASFVFPAINPLSTSDYVSGMVDATTTYVGATVEQTPTQFGAGITGEILNGVSAVFSVKSAYDSCLSSAQ